MNRFKFRGESAAMEPAEYPFRYRKRMERRFFRDILLWLGSGTGAVFQDMSKNMANYPRKQQKVCVQII